MNAAEMECGFRANSESAAKRHRHSCGLCDGIGRVSITDAGHIVPNANGWWPCPVLAKKDPVVQSEMDAKLILRDL